MTIPSIIFVTSSHVRAGSFASARQESLFRAVVCLARVNRILVGTKDHDAMSPTAFVDRLTSLAAEDPQTTVLLCGDCATAEMLALVPPSLQSILAPTDVSSLPEESSALIWVRSAGEQALLPKAAQAQVVPDAFEYHPLPSLEPSERRFGDCVGLVVGEGANAEDIAWIREIVAQKSGITLCITRNTHMRLGPLSPESVVILDDIDDLLAHCPRLYAAGPAGFLLWLRGRALLEDRSLDARPGAIGAEDEPGLNPEACQQAVSAHLGVTALPDKERGALIRANLGFEPTIPYCAYQPWTGLIHMVVECGKHLPPGCAQGYFDTTSGNAYGLVNAWVQTIVDTTPGAPLRLRATAALSPGAHLTDYAVVVTLWGTPVARIPVTTNMLKERAGIIGLKVIDEKEAIIEAWGGADGLTIQAGRSPLAGVEGSRNSRDCVGYSVSTPWPFNRESLTPLPPRGFGTRFSAFQRFKVDLRPTSARLVAMKNAYAGRTGWLIGNGPSVRTADLDALAGTDAVCFGFNRFHLAYEATNLRPNFTVTADAQMIEDFGQQIVDDSGGMVFVAHVNCPPIVGDYVWLRQRNMFPSLFSYDPTRFVTPGGSSLYVALQIGFWLGITRWYLYGADFAFQFNHNPVNGDVFRSAMGDDNHFIKNYRAGRAWCPPAIESILPAFHSARLLMELHGGFIRNTTRGGHMHVFDRVDFDEAVSDNIAAENMGD